VGLGVARVEAPLEAELEGNAGPADVVGDLDRRYPGIRFRIIDEHGRIRQHIKFFVNGLQVRDLSPRLDGDDEVMIVCALSGG